MKRNSWNDVASDERPSRRSMGMHSIDGVELVNGALTDASASLKLTPT